MKVSDRGVAFIAAHEGFVSRAYLDPAGIPTIGYGFTMQSRIFGDWWRKNHGAGLRAGGSISRETANRLLRTLLDHEYGPAVLKSLPHLSQSQFDACVSVVYNLGPRALAWTWARALRSGDTSGAARRLRATGITAGGRKLKGLQSRRNAEARLLAAADYGTARAAVLGPDPQIHGLQAKLKGLGHDPGPLDGILGPRTRAAVRAFQRVSAHLKVDGIPGRATLAALDRAIAKRWGIGAVLGGGGGAACVAATQPLPAWTIAGLGLAAALFVLAGVWAWHNRGAIAEVPARLRRLFSKD